MKQFRSISSLITVISLFLGVIWLSPVSAAVVPAFTSLGQFTAEGMQPPGALDLDSAGNLYVAGTRGGLVYKFNTYGALLQSFQLQATGRGLAVTPDGTRLYVSQANSVVIADALTGEELGRLVGGEIDGQEFGVPGEIDLDAAGNIYVADNGRMQVGVYGVAGDFRTRFGGVGKTSGLFWQIGGMAVNPAGQVVVVDSSSENGRVHVFSLDAGLSVVGVVSYLKSVAANFGTPVMHDPRGLAFDDQGRGYFLEFQSSQVRRTSASFAYLNSYSNPGYGVGQLNNVGDAIYDNVNDRLFVGCDTARIEIFGVDGGSNPVRINHAPTTPLLQSPVAGSEVPSAMPNLVIQNATDEDGDVLTYHVEISQAGEVVYSVDQLAAAGETTTVAVNVALEENGTFFWTVQATDGEMKSDVSSASFVVNSLEEAPSVPALSAPINGESIDGLGVLSWGASVDPDPNDHVITYRVEVALDESFSQVVDTESVSALEMSLGAFAAYADLDDGATYFWRVAALDDTQTISAASTPGRFVYDTTALNVTANMPGAAVSFHGNHAYAGQYIGEAPLQLRDMAAGTFSVVVERAGFEPYIAQVTLTESDNVAVYAELVPAMQVNKLSVSRKGINDRSGLSVSGAAVPFLVDYDNDGDLDMLVGDASGQLSLFANLQQSGNNSINFDPSVSLDLPSMPGAVPFVVDWNNDGRKDLLVGQANGFVTLFINQGLEEAPAFAAGADIFVGSSALYVDSFAAPAVMDCNGDGAKDLLVGNGSGQVLAYLNQGSDASPLFSAATTLVSGLSGAVVPMPIDWDADGQQELLLTAEDVVTVYRLVDGVYQADQRFSEPRTTFTGAFSIDLSGKGKQLLVGQVDGQVVYMTGNSSKTVAGYPLALQDKVAQVGAMVAEAAPQFLDIVTAISALVDAGDYRAASLAANDLALKLAVGPAQVAAFELAELCL